MNNSFSLARWQRARALLKAPCLLSGVGNVHGKAIGRWQRAWWADGRLQRGWCAIGRLATWLVRHWAFGNLFGAPLGVWQPGWCAKTWCQNLLVCGVGNVHLELATWLSLLPMVPKLLGCVALATPILSWQRQLLFFQGQA